MTERELFKKFYGLMRMRDGQIYGTCGLADVSEIEAVVSAALAGMSIVKITLVKASAEAAVELSKRPHSEPSKWSTGIQMLVFTHGRVRRDA